MNLNYRWHDVLISSAREFEKDLALELDHHSFPQHHFSRKYRRKKQSILMGGSNHTVQFILRKCLFILLVVILIIASRSNSPRYVKEPVLDLLKSWMHYMNI